MAGKVPSDLPKTVITGPSADTITGDPRALRSDGAWPASSAVPCARPYSEMASGNSNAGVGGSDASGLSNKPDPVNEALIRTRLSRK